MPQYFNFTRLINKYKSAFTAITLTCGYYNDAGDWVAEDQEKIDLEGAIISFKESKVYRSEGAYTTNDKRLFMLKPIDDKLNGAKVAYEGKVYSVEDNTENAKFTGVYAYTLKFCSAFKGKEHDFDLTDAVWKLEQRLDGVLVEKAPTPPPDENMTESIEKLGHRLDGVE